MTFDPMEGDLWLVADEKSNATALDTDKFIYNDGSWQEATQELQDAVYEEGSFAVKIESDEDKETVLTKFADGLSPDGSPLPIGFVLAGTALEDEYPLN